MREMNRKDFGLPVISRFVLALSAAMLPTIAFILFSLFAIPSWRNGSLSWSIVAIGTALVLTCWGVKNAKRFLDAGAIVTFTGDGLREKYFGIGRIPWDHILAVVPQIETVRGVDYRTLFLRLREPATFFKSVPLHRRMFLPLRSWRSKMVPLYFGAFNGNFEKAIEWIAAYKPEIRIETSDSE